MDTSKTLQVQILRPDGELYWQRACSVIFPAYDGERAVLYDHAPFICHLGSGTIRIQSADDNWDYFYIDGGLLQVKQNFVYIITQTIVPPEKLNRQQIEANIAEINARSTSSDYSPEQKQQELQQNKLKLKVLDQAQSSPPAPARS